MSNFNSEAHDQQERRASSAFQWPSPSQTALLYSDISIKDILDTYQHDVELLKVILIAKAEEDKKRTAEENCKAEEARLRAKTIELELMREAKAPTSVDGNFTQSTDPQLPSLRPNVTSMPEDRHHASPMSLTSDRFVPCSTGSPNGFTYSEPFGSLFSSIPSTPPDQLSPKKDQYSLKNIDFLRDASDCKKPMEDDLMDYGSNPHSPISRMASHYESRRAHKRSHSMATFTRSTIGPSPEIDHENVAHEQVMEALRAKIQRTRNQSGPSTLRNQPPLRHRRSHSAVVNRQKGEGGSSRSPSSDSLSIVGEFSSSPNQEPYVLVETDTTKESNNASLTPFEDLETSLSNLIYDTGSQSKHSDSSTPR